ncbi:MAG TPA: serine/threonine-protein kinase [Pyrinomonadaceae bacterium]
MPPSPGTKFGRYEIRSKIGAGGMGEVYLAYDDQLHRSVAIKILPEDLGQDQQRMQRFIQEARSASALNHPNILTIYEVGQNEGVQFIVTEFIDGENLRDHFRSTDIKLGELLDIAIQISSALAKAHSSGIVHRDIKPENIMLTRDGYVKVLDFGLSKLTEQCLSTDLDASTQALINTEPGKVMGTTRYMSPEQARGLAVDARSDIWSLGVVLYEALTGRAPFDGSTSTDLIVSILEREPAPIARFNPHVPQQLERIIRKTLAKDPDERYQVIKDLQIDLRNLKRELELEAEIDRTLPPEVRAAALSTKGSTQSQVETILGPHSTSPTKSVSSAEYVVTGIRQHKTVALLTVGVMLVIGVAAFLWLGRRTPALTDKDTILLADFTNTTGDAVFDGTLKQALAVQLAQSPYLSIAPDDAIRETLRFMNRSPDERLTRDIAREVCQRTGVKALMAGTISSLGSNYVLTLEAVNAQSGDIFAREQIETSRKEDVLKGLGTIASHLRERLGESLASIQKFDAPIEQATTSSLDALKAFSLGDEKRAQGKYDEAIPFYERAVSLDQNFALAYARLSTMHFNLREEVKTKQYAQQSFGLRDRVSEREKFYIAANYYQNVPGDLEKAIETLELWRQTYPRDYVPLNNLAVNYSFLGDFEKQLEAGRESLRLNPNTSSPYSNIAWAYLRLNRLDEAAKTIDQAIAQNKAASFGIHGAMYILAYLKRDVIGMSQQAEWVRGKPFESVISGWAASSQFSSGKLKEARASQNKGTELALHKDQKDVAARFHLQAGEMELLVGNCGMAVDEIRASLAQFRGIDQLSFGAFIFASCGKTAESESLVKELNAQYPHDTGSSKVILPMVKAVNELNANNPAKAIEALEPVRRYELGEFGELWPNYLRGLAYLKLVQPKTAAQEFQKILDHPAIAFISFLSPIAQLNVARAWTQAARSGKSETSGEFSDKDSLGSARKAYQDFLANWKDADTDNPLFIQAKKEYAELPPQ